MNSALIALELRKNRLTLAGLGMSFVVILPLSLLAAPRAGLDAARAVEAGLILWTLAGLPLSVVFLGATAGAGLCGADVRDAEAPFPESAAGRVLRALAGAALQFLILALATVLLSAAASSGWRSAVLGTGEAPTVWMEIAPLRGLIAFLAADLLAGSFIAAYVLGHAFAGGLIGVVLAIGEAVALGLGLQYPIFFPDRVDSFVPFALCAALVGLAAKVLAVRPIAARLERARPLGLAGAAGMIALLAVGLLTAAGAEETAYARLMSSLRLLRPGASSYFMTLGSPADEAEAALFPAVRGAGALAATAAGGLFWIAPDGRLVRLLPEGETGRFTLNGPFRTQIEAAVWDESGRLLVSRRSAKVGGDKIVFWVGRPQGGLHPVDPTLGFAEQIVREEGAVGIRFRKGVESRFCVLDDEGRARRCSPDKAAPSTDRSFGKRAVVRAVGAKSDVLPDGTLVSQRPDGWRVVDPSGTVRPVLRSQLLFERWPRTKGETPRAPMLVHRAGGRDWVVLDEKRLVEMDEETGRPLKDWLLPAAARRVGSFDGLRVLEGGLVIQEFSAPFFVGWDGKSRVLRAP